MSELTAVDVLRNHQKQCDFDGIEVQVSRQALDETLDKLESLQRENEELREHVKEAEAGAGEANELVKIIGRRQFITPEMRERLLRSLRWKNADKPSWGEAVYMRDSINMVLNTGGEG